MLQAEGYVGPANDYDWIGFDPRGVGSSVPAITCMPDYLGPDRPNYVPNSPTILNYWLTKSAAYARKCDSQSAAQSALLRHMSTIDVVHDVDYIRELLGQKQINYYGFSYGTDLGQTYATLFPSHVRRMILDSNVNMTRVGYDDFNLDQDGPFDRNENIWFGWLAKVNHHDAAAASEVVGLYQNTDAPGNDNSFAVYNSVLCTDSPWPHDWSTWSGDTWDVFHHAPFIAWGNTWFNAPCLYWHAPSHALLHIDGSKVRSMLLIEETLDAATPFEGSLVTRQLFPTSVLVAEPGGTSHADSLFGDLCVDSTIARYLDDGTLPPRDNGAQWDKTCAPLPQPVPAGASATATRVSARDTRLVAAAARLARRLERAQVR